MLEEWLDGCDRELRVNVEVDGNIDDDPQVYKMVLGDAYFWLTEEDLNKIVKSLNKAKRIRKERKV